MDALVMCGGRGTRLDADVEKPLFTVGGDSMVDRVLAALAGSRIETTYAVVSPNAPETREHLQILAASGDESADRGDEPPAADRRSSVTSDAGVLAVVETPGEGYVTDLGAALDEPAIEPPVLSVAADLSLLEPATIDRLLDAYDRLLDADDDRCAASVDDPAPSMTVAVPASLKGRLGVTVESTLPEVVVERSTVDGAIADSPLRDGVALAPTGVNVVAPSQPTTEPNQVIHVTHDPALAINVNRREDARVAERLLADRRSTEGSTCE